MKVEFRHRGLTAKGQRRRCPNCGHVMRGVTWMMIRRRNGRPILITRVCDICRHNGGLTRRHLVRGLWLRVKV